MPAVILQRTEDARHRSRRIGKVVELLESLSHDKSWRVEVEQAKSERSLEQNRYLFGCAYTLLSEHLGFEKQDIHEYLLGLHFGTRLKKVPPTERNPEGLIEVPMRSTTVNAYGKKAVLGKMEFSDYVAFVQRFGCEHGVLIPDPDPNYRFLRERAA